MAFSSQSPSRLRAAACLVAATLAFASFNSNAARAADGFPYVAYVIESGTYVRSGPGAQHYPTGQLSAGYAVEVYRHDGDGWCAIRPPEGSFSLAPAHQLKVLDSRTAEVTAAGVVARVGSGLGEQRNAVQVLLERGELVQLVEQPTPGQPWVKIAPPAGEFRWIASRRLARTPPVENTSKRESNWIARPGSASAISGLNQSPPTKELSSSAADEAPGGFAHLTSPQSSAVKPALAVGNSAWHPEAAPAEGGALTTSKAADDISVVEGSPAQVRLAQFQDAKAPPVTAAESAAPTAAADAEPKSAQPRIRFSGVSAGGPVEPRVAEMQLKLSQIVVQPPSAWKLAALREETAAQLAQEQSPQVREQLRDLLDRIVTFEAVQSRYVGGQGAAPSAVAGIVAGGQLAGGAAPAAGMTGQSGEVLARVRSDLGRDSSITPTPGGPNAVAAQAVPAGAPPATEALYDAVGTLKPVVSRREKAPHYALVDDHGDVVTFVTAAADVNLQPFVGKRIGVRGSRGFMPEYRRAHVTASRVTPLEEKLIR